MPSTLGGRTGGPASPHPTTPPTPPTTRPPSRPPLPPSPPATPAPQGLAPRGPGTACEPGAGSGRGWMLGSQGTPTPPYPASASASRAPSLLATRASGCGAGAGGARGQVALSSPHSPTCHPSLTATAIPPWSSSRILLSRWQRRPRCTEPCFSGRRARRGHRPPPLHRHSAEIRLRQSGAYSETRRRARRTSRALLSPPLHPPPH